MGAVILGLVVAYGVVVALAWAFQDRLVWFPGPRGADPSAAGLEFREVVLETSDGLALGAWFVPGPVGAGAVLVSNGNAGSMSDRLGLARVFHDMGRSVLLYDYRGYGGNPGRPSEDGTYRDAEAAFDWLTGPGGVAPGDVTLYGESLGGAVAIALATRRPAGRLIVENTFTTLPEVGQRAYPWLPVKLLSSIRYDSLSRVAGLAMPKLVIHSPEDELIPVAHGRRLAEAAGAAFLATGGGHNGGGFLQRPEWRARVAAFLDD